MRTDVTILQKHASDFWLARDAIALTVALNLILVNNLTIGHAGWFRLLKSRFSCRSRSQRHGRKNGFDRPRIIITGT